ncbi:helix-turn-helix domain-containing protein [Nocardioides campestrisoli]|uniref:helix-turn-helix domain-containing protein n=1 Tax=Nocardioides campestrisoli TaxID=2736757 RepID=UPI0015E7A37E|nr:helix-turn-helix transcriptional regulator [Nocardioides campestrisoli]
MTYDGKASARSLAQTVLALHHMSATELADHAGVDRKTVADFLNGARWPREKNLGKISEALSLAPEILGRVSRAELFWEAGADGLILVHHMDRPDSIRMEVEDRLAAAQDSDAMSIQLRELEEMAESLLDRVRALRADHEEGDAGRPKRPGQVVSYAGSGKTMRFIDAVVEQQQAARRGASSGRAQRAEQDEVATASQDPGGIDPA